MIETVRQDILSVLKEARHMLKERHPYLLKGLSNHTMHNASIFQDEDSISIAVIMYSISKLIERNKFNFEKAISLIEDLQHHLLKNEIENYKKTIKLFFDFISGVDDKFRLYVEEVIEQARIKKGSKLYYHGISIAQASELLGITQWELMGYVGKTRMTDTNYEEDAKPRLEFARYLFR